MSSMVSVSLSHIPVIARLMWSARHVLGNSLQLTLASCLRAWRGSVKSPSAKQSGQPTQADELRVPRHCATRVMSRSLLDANLNIHGTADECGNRPAVNQAREPLSYSVSSGHTLSHASLVLPGRPLPASSPQIRSAFGGLVASVSFSKRALAVCPRARV